jgi:hypothetical protein
MCDRDQDGAEGTNENRRCDVGDETETAGDEEGARGCGTLLMIEATACVGKGCERV